MILAIIFLITDLFMVGIAYAVYGRTAVAGYSDGMVLGVHIRREKQEDPVLVKIIKKMYRRFIWDLVYPELLFVDCVSGIHRYLCVCGVYGFCVILWAQSVSCSGITENCMI